MADNNARVTKDSTPENTDGKPFGDIVGIPLSVIGEVARQAGMVMIMWIAVALLTEALGLGLITVCAILVLGGLAFKAGGDYLKKRSEQRTEEYSVFGACFGYAA